MQLKRNKGIEFETLKKSYKKQVIIGALAICVIGGTLTFNLTRSKYKVTDSIPVVKGTINYSVPDLRVVAIKTSEDGENYTDVSDVPASGYILNTTNSICKLATTDAKDENITIEYKDGKVNFLGVGNKNTRCYLYFDKYVPTSEETLEKLNIININSGTPVFSNIAATDEGVYAMEDGMYGGESYYWRGAATNNYVKFASFCWRIVRINGDGSIRLIYDGSICHDNGTKTSESLIITNQSYNTKSDRSEYVGYTYTEGQQRGNATESNLKLQNDNWYENNLKSYEDKIADGKFCNYRSVGLNYSWASQPSSAFYYARYDQSGATGSLDAMPILSCLNEDIYTLKIGAITMDEIIMAGGKWGASNVNYYLYNGQYYWSMTPYSWSYGSSSDRRAAVFYVNSSGNLSNNGVNDLRGIRGVINLNSNVTFSGGDGTLNNPYIVQ